MDTLTFQPVTDLVDLLRGAGLKADTDPARLNLPGAWVTVELIRPLVVDGSMLLECVVYLIVGDRDYKRAYARLADLYNLMGTVLTPDDVVVPQGVVMPGDPTPLPALRVPVHLITT